MVVREIAGALSSCGMEVILAGSRKSLGRYRAMGVPRFGGFLEVTSRRYTFGWWCEKLSLHIRGYEIDGDLLTRRVRREVAEGGDVHLVANYPQYIPPPHKAAGAMDILVYDLNWLHFPENYRNPARTEAWMGGWVEAAGMIFAISEFTRREIVEHYGAAPENTAVVHPAVPGDAAHLQVGTDSGDVLARYGLEAGGYFYCPGSLRPHKGIDVLCGALEQAASEVKVALTGWGVDMKVEPEKWPFREYLEVHLPRLRRLRDEGKLLPLGFLDRKDQLLLASQAKAFVLPSRYEGYGLGVVEAIGLGRPLVCSEIAPFVEVLRSYPHYSAYRLFPTGDSEALATILSEADFSIPPHDATGAEGWSWQKAAEAMLAVWAGDEGCRKV